MKIEMLCRVANAYGVFPKGSVVDWPDYDARPLVESGVAVPADDPPRISVGLFASDQAEALAAIRHFEPEDAGGSGAGGAYTVADIKSLTADEEEHGENDQ